MFVTRLDDDAALKKAADFMGEVFIFAARRSAQRAARASLRLVGAHFARSADPPAQVAGVAVVYEVTVSKAKDDAKAAATAAEKAQLRDAFVEVKEALRETVRARSAALLVMPSCLACTCRADAAAALRADCGRAGAGHAAECCGGGGGGAAAAVALVAAGAGRRRQRLAQQSVMRLAQSAAISSSSAGTEERVACL